MAKDCCSTQLIFADGEFNAAGLDNFVKSVKLSECGLSYAVVAIMGPQSSGKSTLLNHLFFTNFTEMDAFRGRNQTTKGIWIAKAVGIEPLTVVLDLEGTDGRERGEDDTAFEKQSALFALAIADIVLINIWCHDIGREHAANRPLLKTVFQVMMRLFSPRRTTLLFVIRDKTKTPLERLELVLREDIQKIWDSVSKPGAHKNTPLSEYFNVQVTALSSYEEKEDQFKEQVAEFRKQFFNSIAPCGLAGDRRGVVPASGFSYSAQQIWEVIRENKDLDLPAHKVMVATVRCEEIANEKFNHFISDERRVALEDAVKSGPVSSFGKQLSSILDTHLSEYDMEAMYFDEHVRGAKRQQLMSKLLQIVYPTYVTLLGHFRCQANERFRTQLEKSLRRGESFAASVRACKEACFLEFDNHCADAAVRQADWDASRVREKLSREIEAYASSIRDKKLSEINTCYEKQLSDSLGAPVETLLESGRSDTWVSIKKLLERDTETAVSAFVASISGFELDESASHHMVQSLRAYARSVVVKKAREQAGKVLMHMKDRFTSVFNHDEDSMPRVWTGKEDIRKITRDACSAALRILSVMAAIRLDEKPDSIENMLFSSLMDQSEVPSSPDREVCATVDPLASSSWDGVSSENTLITPVQCKSLWRQFTAETEYSVTQAIAAQEASKRSSNWLPPPWAIVAMLVLGFNEFMILLRNPLYILALFVMYLVTNALWIQMEIPAEFRNGTLAGLISISSKLVPTVMNLLRRLAEEAQGHPRTESQRPPLMVSSYSSRNESHPESSVTESFPNLSVSSTESISVSSPGLTHRRDNVTMEGS